MKKELDIEKIHYISLELKKLIMNEPKDEAKIAVDRFIQFLRTTKWWAIDEEDVEKELP